MQVFSEETGSLEGFARVLEQAANAPGAQALMVLAADANGHTPANTDPVLRAQRLPVFGGVFPQLIVGPKRLMRGTVVVALSKPVRPWVVRGLGAGVSSLDEAVEPVLDLSLRPATVLVFVDGFARRLSALLRSLFGVHGLEANFLGGGAGSLSLRPQPCVITPEGLLQDVAVVVQWPVFSGVGVAHGWEVIAEPLQVTRASHNIVHELNHRPALEVYRALVGPHAGRDVGVEGFFDVAKAYPFGIRKLGAEVVVRDPLQALDDGSLVCVGEVPPLALVHVLHGRRDSLLAAAALARDRARQSLPAEAGPAQAMMVIDCISRCLFLGEDFDDELAALDLPGLPRFGALTLGEIANTGRDYLEFYNKTAVVGLLGAMQEPRSQPERAHA